MRRIWAASVASDSIDLASGESRHLRDVLRAREGDLVVVFDGEGRERTARVESVGRRGVCLRAESPVVESPSPPGPSVHLAIALLRGEAMDRVVRGATELGVAAVVPFVAERSQPRPRGVDRWRRIAREAARQSGRSRVPAVGDPVPLADAIRALPEGRRIVLFEEERTDRLSNLAAHPTIVLAIGPEGGWTSGEIERLEGAGFEPSGLSDGILRAETAALAAVSVVRTLSLKGGAWGA